MPKPRTMKTKSILNVTVAGLALLAGGSASAQPGLATAEIQALTEAPDKVQRVACVNNLKQLGIAFQIWTANNGDLLPPDVLSMSNEVASTKALVCPADTGRQPANDWGSFTAANLSYKFLAPSAKVAAPQQVVLLCPIHGNVMLMDGSVQSRIARTHPEQFILKDGKLYFGEPVIPARFPITMTVTHLDHPTTAPPPVTPSSGSPGIRMGERMMTAAPITVTPSTDTPSIRMDDQMMERYGLLPPSAMPTATQTASGLEIQPQAGLKSTGRGERANTESEALKRNLKDKDPKVRRAAIEKLGRDLSEGAQVRLTPRKELLDKLEATQNDCARLIAKSLQDEDQEVRMVAASVLYLCGPSAEVALPQLLEVLQGTNWPLKSIAALTLGNVGTNAAIAVPALKQLMNTTLGGTRTVAAQALWRITRQAPLVLPALVEALEFTPPNSVETSADPSAALTLAEIGPEAKAAVPALSRLLQAKDQRTRIAAAAALVRISPDTAGVAEALGAGLQPPPTGYEVMAQRALRELGPKSLPVLVKAANDPSPAVRRLAIETLGSLGSGASEAVPLLAVKLADPDAFVRRAAADALGKMGPESKAAAPQLRIALKDPSGLARAAAAAALIRVDPPAVEAIPVLLEVMSPNPREPSDPMVVWNVVQEISPAAVPAVLEFLKGAPAAVAGFQQRDQQKWFRLRENAIALLGHMGPNAQAAIPALIEVLDNKRLPHRREAAESLGLIGPAAIAAVPSLKAALVDQDARLRLNSAVALARIDPQDGSHVLTLIQFLKDRDASLRAAVASSLGELGARARSAIPDLRQLASDDDDESVLREVIRAVGAIESDTAKPVRE